MADAPGVGIILAAPASGSGKTTITLALLRRLRQLGVAAAPAKVGPDYIDPAFHTAAAGHTCYNLDSWAMRPATLAGAIQACGRDIKPELIVTEGVMGLFDGAPDGGGSTAELAALTGWPVVLVADAQGMAASAAALVHGFNSYHRELRLAGVIFNRIGGPGHARLLEDVCAPLAIPVLGCVPRRDELVLPERHLGLVQAQEHVALDAFLDRAAALISEHVDIAKLRSLARPHRLQESLGATPLAPLGRHIAVARDLAFAFCYPFVLDAWRAAGSTISFFSPLADETPAVNADAVYLPGGYPELHAARLSANGRFMASLRAAAQRGVLIYGECGGYMVLGQGLIDAASERHAMAGLLPVETSFAERRLHLGYRQLTVIADGWLGPAGSTLRGHEFHFASLLSGASQTALFTACDARGQDLGPAGSRVGAVMGSFMHLIDSA